jgi:hypothetical protein
MSINRASSATLESQSSSWHIDDEISDVYNKNQLLKNWAT